MYSLEGKSAVITGGGSGIGKAIATLFATQGATVHILEMNAEAATATITALNGSSAVLRAHAHSCDVSNQEQVKSVFQEIGQVDILVNNAGIAHVGTVETTTEEDFTRVFDVNVRGAYNCLHAAIPLMKAQGKGVILNIASIAALVGITDRFAYSMSKGAIYAMTLSVARDYLAHNIRCNSISPARVHTPFVDGFIAKNYPGKESEIFEKLSKSQPIGRMGEPAEVANLALFLCADEASFITGNDYPLDGGFVKLNN
ncbi:oxidoreductase [Pedobacter quisquiliarum]|uniref:Oxidoreductase n=1 Tax=Pedobacter quisquiliarum TaxID=1834438 RepID=A0A916U8C0_9SPHI|nr:SDR family oxidoreductase [Pedobacter quisquiliarum]GGC62340.1 oxidoreductase [Pedobacter quisquiliarum]